MKIQEGSNLLPDPDEVDERYREYFINLLSVGDDPEDDRRSARLGEHLMGATGYLNEVGRLSREEGEAAAGGGKNRKSSGVMDYRRSW